MRRFGPSREEHRQKVSPEGLLLNLRRVLCSLLGGGWTEGIGGMGTVGQGWR